MLAFVSVVDAAVEENGNARKRRISSPRRTQMVLFGGKLVEVSFVKDTHVSSWGMLLQDSSLQSRCELRLVNNS